MMNRPSVRFSCTALAGTGKTGRLPRDADGYYTMPLGGLNVFNSLGEYYTYEGAKELFTGSGALMRRIKSGTLKGEYGHPKPAGPIRTQAEMEVFAGRVMRIDEGNTCVHYSDIWLDFDNVRSAQGQKVIAIMGKLCPSGPRGPALEKSLDNPKEEVCFSVRAFTEDKVIRGIKQRELREIVTWDFVTEPGLDVARKYRSPALEAFNAKGHAAGAYQSLQGVAALETYEDVTFNKDAIMSTIVSPDGIAMESNAMGLNLIRTLGWDIDPAQVPKYLNW